MGFHPLQKTLVPLFRKSLETYSLRHAATAENIANAETRRFRPLEVQFESELRRAMNKGLPAGRKTSDRHLDIGGADMQSLQPRVRELDARVDIEQEMAQLARNQIRFDFVSRMLRGSYDSIKTSIRGRVG